MGAYLDKIGSQNILQHSLLHGKLYHLEKIGQVVRELKVSGIVAEAGVYKGGSAKLLATIFDDRDILLFDSFEGMKEQDDINSSGHKMGDFSDCSLELVQKYLADHPNCRFYKGWFPTSAEFLTTEQFSMVHLDMDYYQSTKAGIEVFWPRLVQGGIMVVDDYGWEACPGVEQAFNEYFEERSDYQILPSEFLTTIAVFKK